MSKIAECILCNKPDYLKGICKYRDYPFNEPKIEYLDMNARCSKRTGGARKEEKLRVEGILIKKDKKGKLTAGRRKTEPPKIVCLCGSTRFADLHAIKRWELEKDGKVICLMINYLPAWYAKEQGWDEPDHLGEQSGVREFLDELHLRKIDLADEVFVINKDGYIGESTKREIEYAEANGKPVHYLWKGG